MKPRCTKCNNRLTVKDIDLIGDMASWNIDAGGRLNKEERLALRRLYALKRSLTLGFES